MLHEVNGVNRLISASTYSNHGCRCVGCKQAQSAWDKARYARNPEPAKARARKYRAANPEHRKKNGFEWYRKNQEVVKARSRRWYRDNIERVRAYRASHVKPSTKPWKLANPEKVRFYN